MTSFNPLADKAYAVRLADLGENREVIASEDIFNDQGALLIKKGMPINRRMSDRIIKFKLLKPIESSIDVAGSLGAMELCRDINSIVDDWEWVRPVHNNLGLEKSFKQLALLLSKYPVLRQKLTVMQEQMDKLYFQTLAVTWLSVAIAAQMNLSESQMEDCFLAALAHDIGMLHIDPAVLEKTEELTAPEWRQIQAHTLIGKTLLENISGMKPRVSRIVAEHHERCDGTGYPVGKFSEKLTLESQIIAMSDSVISVYLNKFKKSGKTLRDLLPFIQVNSESHFYACYAALIMLFKHEAMAEHSFITNHNVAEQLDTLINRNDDLSYLLEGLDLILTEITQQHEHRYLQSSTTILTQVMKTVRGSGILDEGYVRWLKQVKTDKLESAYREAADALIMLDEIEWHLKRTVKMLDSFLEQATTIETSEKEKIRSKLAIAKLAPEVDKQSLDDPPQEYAIG